ncbi:MAG: Fe-S-binding domain-containing protein [Actinomycetota bacterium]|nr:Fe-S-binding domain-containing protein [Actinomycetota bacterium]
MNPVPSAAAQAALLPLPVAIPICGAVAAPLLARSGRTLPLIVSVGAMLASLSVLVLIAPGVFAGHPLVHYLGGWGPVDGVVLGIGFAADPFGLAFALATAAIGTLLLVATMSELGGLGRGELGGYACLFQLLLAALIGGALTADLFNLFVWFEVAALASYGLTGFFLERPLALEAAFKLLVLTTIASFAVFIGIGLLYADHGALNFGQLHQALAGRLATPDLIALGLLVSGFATKAGLVPFHGWLADAHTAAPGPVSALFSGLMVNFGIVAIVRLGYQVYGFAEVSILPVLTVIGAISALLGAILALAQDDLKRLLAYDTVSQMGVLAVGLGTATTSGVGGAVYHLLNHTLFKSLLLLCAGAVVHITGQTHLSRMGGLARRTPVLTLAFLFGIGSIVGVPPFNGYVSLSLIHRGLLAGHHQVTYVVMLIAQLLTIAALGRAAWLAFFRARSQPYPQLTRLRPGMITALGTLAGCCVLFGVLPRLLLTGFVAPAVNDLLNADNYVAAVLLRQEDIASRMAPTTISFDYNDLAELLSTGISVVLAGALTWWYLRHPEPRPVRALRALHTGSVQDYAGFAVLGLIAVSTALTLH